MGWDDSRVMLVPPGWRPILRPGPKGARTVTGDAVRVIDVEREPEPQAPVPSEAVQRSLEQDGFAEEEGSERHRTLRKGEVEAFLGLEGAELRSLLLTFKLSRDAPTRAADWEKLVRAVCARWSLSLVDMGLGKRVGTEQFLAVLGRTSSWRNFAQQLGWPPLDASATSGPP